MKRSLFVVAEKKRPKLEKNVKTRQERFDGLHPRDNPQFIQSGTSESGTQNTIFCSSIRLSASGRWAIEIRLETFVAKEEGRDDTELQGS